MAALKACVQGVFDEAKQEKEEKMQAKFAAKTACFVDNGCDDPDIEAKKEEWKAKKQARFQCMAEAFESDLKDTLQTCVQKDVADFEFGDDFFEMMKNKKRFFGKGRRGHGHRGKGGMYKFVSKICDMREEALAGCPDDAAKSAAKDCLAGLGGRGRGGHGRKEHKAGLIKCFKDMSKDCKHKLMDIKGSLCDCAAEALEDESVMEKIHACHQEDGDEEDEADDNEHAQMIKKKLVGFFCMRKHGHGKHGSSSESHESDGSHGSHGSHESHEKNDDDDDH
jgi:hypothetical protein